MILNLESSGFSFTVEPNEAPASMGREEPCTIVVESSSVSRKHCELTCDGDQWFVKDLSSRYGTTVNGKSATKPTPLGNGDVLKLGSQNFIVSLLASNDMEDLGRHLSGGKVRGLIGQAMQKRPVKKEPPAKKKKYEPTRDTMMLEKDGEDKPADVAADASSNEPKKEDSEPASEAEADADEKQDEGEAKATPAGKFAKKASMRARSAPKKKSSPLLTALKFVVLLGALGGAGFFGWQQYQQQQQQAQTPPQPTAPDGTTPPLIAPGLKLPPKPNAVALPVKPEENAAPAPDPKPDIKPEEKPVAKPDEKAEPAEPKPEEKKEEK